MDRTVSLDVYDVTGRFLETLVDGHHASGIYQINWNGRDLSAGIYFCRFQARDFTDVKKMILLR